jgi:EAL domain-containing protein (putative c-di-GMP-specific phosphodiesterase class I)
MRRALDWLAASRITTSSNGMFVVMKLNAESLHDHRFQRQALRLLRAQPSTAAALRIEVNARHLARGPGAAAEFIERARATGTRAVLGGLAQVPVWMPQLLALRPAAIKLDVSLADNDREQPTTHQSIRLLLDHCRALGIEACATRIESTRALEWACRVGFDQVQGFLLGKPDAVARTTQHAGSGSAASAS